MRNHVRSVHGKERGEKCLLCDYAALNKQRLNDHTRSAFISPSSLFTFHFFL